MKGGLGNHLAKFSSSELAHLNLIKLKSLGHVEVWLL